MIEGIVAEFSRSPPISFMLISQNAIGPIVSFTWTAPKATKQL